MFKNRVLRRIFGPKREKVAGGWRRPYNEELQNMDVSTRIMGGACSTYGKNEKCLHFWLECLRGRDYSEDLGINRNIILKFILGKKKEWECVDWMYLAQVRNKWRWCISVSRSVFLDFIHRRVSNKVQ
jgi:hypothetical protein